jgi:hypothetical protein
VNIEQLDEAAILKRLHDARDGKSNTTCFGEEGPHWIHLFWDGENLSWFHTENENLMYEALPVPYIRQDKYDDLSDELEKITKERDALSSAVLKMDKELAEWKQALSNERCKADVALHLKMKDSL